MSVGVPEENFITNRHPRCPCLLLLDNSGSMAGDPIKQLNAGLSAFAEGLEKDSLAKQRVEVAIVSFGPVKTVQDFITAESFSAPELKVDGGTPMGEAIGKGLDMLEMRKQHYRSAGLNYFRPWIFLITDGAPTDDWKDAADRVRDGEENKEFLFYAVGVEGADFKTLTDIAPPSRPPMKLNTDPEAFRQMFEWLSSSLTRISHSGANPSHTPDFGEDNMEELPPVGWGSAPPV